MNKKLLTVMASALMFVGIGSVTANTSTQIVSAATTMKSPDTGHIVYDQDTTYNELRRANIVTPYLNYTGKNSVKFHWYKNPHTRSGWDNMNENISFDTFGGGGVENFGIVTTIGTATINGRKYYMYLNDGDSIALGNSSVFKRPNVIKSKKQLPTYDISGTKDSGYEVTDVGYDCPSSVFIIPTHHNSVTFPSREKHGKLDQFVPVISGYQNGGFGSSFIRKADYDYLIRTGSPAKNVHFDNGSILYSKNGKVYVKPNANYMYWQKRTAESVLHNDKYAKNHTVLTKKILINDLYRTLKAQMRNLKETGTTNQG